MAAANRTYPDLPLALTMGDPSGIGTEITLSAWEKRKETGLPAFVALSRKNLFLDAGKKSASHVPVQTVSSAEEAMEIFADALPVLELSQPVEAIPGKPDTSSGAMVIKSISLAVDLLYQRKVGAIVTNPINKHVLYDGGFRFPGHTEFLADLAKQKQNSAVNPVMMLVSKQLRTVPLTIHIPLSEVEKHISCRLIVDTVQTISQDMKKYFDLDNPRIAVAGLNPHAGENGAMGRAEIDIIQPAIAMLQKDNINISGPWPADTMFHAKARHGYDVALGMYHDQALIPIKTLSFDTGVNVTLGLPFVRTSPDHGTAYDIAGKGLASPDSLIEALLLAGEMAGRDSSYRRNTGWTKS